MFPPGSGDPPHIIGRGVRAEVSQRPLPDEFRELSIFARRWQIDCSARCGAHYTMTNRTLRELAALGRDVFLAEVLEPAIP